MGTATITINDVEEGIQVAVAYSDGFNGDSGANVIGHKLMQHLNTLLDPISEELVVGNAPSALQNGHEVH